MRRMTPVLLPLGALLAASVLAAPMAGAAPQADRPASAPSGWEKVDGAELAEITKDSDATKQAPLAEGKASARAAEPDVWAFASRYNGRFVATEKSYAAPNTGVLRARSAEFSGSWEEYELEWDDATETYALKSHANDRYVTVEQNYTGNTQNVLRARSTSVGGWERFVFWYNETEERWALQSASNGLFVTMENNTTGKLQYVLRARSASVGGWESFDLYSVI